jgi:hypothetical protein
VPDEFALLYWHFPTCTVTFTLRNPNAVEGIDLISRALATPRGLRVGDGRARVRELYGPPLGDPGNPDATQWVYADSPDVPHHMIIITFADDDIVSIAIRHFRF